MNPGRSYPPCHSDSRLSFKAFFARRVLLDGLRGAGRWANRDIAVLQIGGPDGGLRRYRSGLLKRSKPFTAGCEGAIQFLVTAGLVDPAKVGIIGFQPHRMACRVHADPFSNAIGSWRRVADNIDGSYFQYVLDPNDRRIFDETREMGGLPLGDALGIWGAHGPRFQCRSGPRFPCAWNWIPGRSIQSSAPGEMFSNLRYLRKTGGVVRDPGHSNTVSTYCRIRHTAPCFTRRNRRLGSPSGSRGEEDPDPREGGPIRSLARTQKRNRSKGLSTSKNGGGYFERQREDQKRGALPEAPPTNGLLISLYPKRIMMIPRQQVCPFSC